MSNEYELSTLPSVLYDKMKKNNKIDITKVPSRALGISYPSFLKRARSNRLLFSEVSKVATLYGYKVHIQIEELDFVNTKKSISKGKPDSSNSSQNDLYKIIDLTEEIGALRLENQRLTYENERLKEQLGGGNGKKK
jgi:hypothetical protein